MDIEFLVQMIFVLVLSFMVGAVVLLFPLAKRMGALAEEWLRIRKMEAEEGGGRLLTGEIQALDRAVASIDSRLDGIVEKQEFVESLIESDKQTSLT